MEPRLDAEESSFFDRELEHIKSRVFDVKYVDLKARSFIPVDHSVPAAAESFIYQQYDTVGVAKIISNYADDLPRSDVKGKEFTGRIKTLGSAFGYNYFEIKAAAMAKKPLQQRRANAARRAIHEKEDQIAAYGDAVHELPGLFSHPNIPIYTSPDHGNGTQWEKKKPDQILEEMHAFVQQMLTVTKSIEKPDTLVLPPTVLGYIATKRLGDTETTVLQYFKKTNPWIRTVDEWQVLEDAGVAKTRRMMAYRRSPDVLELVIPEEFLMHPPQQKNFENTVACHSRIGGVTVYYPLAIAFQDGI